MALADLAQMVEVIGHHAAQDFGVQMLNNIDGLPMFPNRGRVVPEIRKPHIREIIQSPYRVIYRVLPANSRIWHAKRGVPELPPEIL